MAAVLQLSSSAEDRELVETKPHKKRISLAEYKKRNFNQKARYKTLHTVGGESATVEVKNWSVPTITDEANEIIINTEVSYPDDDISLNVDYSEAGYPSCPSPYVSDEERYKQQDPRGLEKALTWSRILAAKQHKEPSKSLFFMKDNIKPNKKVEKFRLNSLRKQDALNLILLPLELKIKEITEEWKPTIDYVLSKKRRFISDVSDILDNETSPKKSRIYGQNRRTTYPEQQPSQMQKKRKSLRDDADDDGGRESQSYSKKRHCPNSLSTYIQMNKPHSDNLYSYIQKNQPRSDSSSTDIQMSHPSACTATIESCKLSASTRSSEYGCHGNSGSSGYGCHRNLFKASCSFENASRWRTSKCSNDLSRFRHGSSYAGSVKYCPY